MESQSQQKIRMQKRTEQVIHQTYALGKKIASLYTDFEKFSQFEKPPIKDQDRHKSLQNQKLQTIINFHEPFVDLFEKFMIAAKNLQMENVLEMDQEKINSIQKSKYEKKEKKRVILQGVFLVCPVYQSRAKFINLSALLLTLYSILLID